MKPFDYEKRFKRLRNRLILLFAFAGLAVIVISNILNYRISSSIDTKEDISSLINISGRQRMLSQSITKTALLIQHEKMPQSFARDLDSLLVLFEQSHRHLLERNKFLKSKEIDDRFIQIQSSFDGLYEIGKTFLSGPSITKETSLLIEQESRFIPQMDAIVMVYEKLSFEGYQTINRNVDLSNFAIILLAVVSVIITCLAVIQIVKRYSLELTNQANELRKTNLELDKSKMKEQFAYIASHDLQEPVRTIISLTDLLQDSHQKDLNEEGNQIVQFISESSHRMSRLIKGLLDYSRLGKNQALEHINLNELVRTIQEDLNSQVIEKKATITCKKLPSIMGYRLDIKSLFQNLISNAMKFSKAEIAPVIKISSSEDKEYWYFEVDDNGIGIEEKDQEKVFQIFQKLHSRNAYEGVGLGLANCQRITEIHRGTIEVESTLGEGSCFRFSINKKLS